MKIHVMLKKNFIDELSIKKVIEVGQMTNVDQERALEFGVVSGDAPPGVEDSLRALDEVEDVVYDGIQSI